MTKVLTIGLDGVPLDLLIPWVEAGKLPTIARLMEQGSFGNVNSTTPHTSGPAWTSFMTGKNPGKTGIYDFLRRQKDSYTFLPNNSRSRAAKSLWSLLSEEDKRVIVMNVPLTYPVEPVNGLVISGWMTPYGKTDFTYPPHLLEELEKEIGSYHIYPIETFSEKHPENFFSASKKLLSMRTKTALHLMEKEDWDFFMTVFFDTDRMLHQVWHYLDEHHPLYEDHWNEDLAQPVIEYFQAIDHSIAQLVEKAGEDTNVVIMSDHGMGHCRNMIVLNTWLLQKGFLKLKRNPFTRLKRVLFNLGFTIRNVHRLADSLNLARHAEYKMMYSADRLLKKVFLSFDDIDWSRSKAYSFGRSNGPIFINVKGREPEGIVEPGEEYEAIRREIASMADQLIDPETGEVLVGQILWPEDIYSGPFADEAPDLIFEPANQGDKFYGLSDFGSNKVIHPFYRYTGMHRQHGLFILCGPDFSAGVDVKGAQIIDFAPTLLHAMGLPIPDDMDGRPWLEVFRGKKKESAVWAETSSDGQSRKTEGYSQRDVSEIEDRLRKMGYLG
ncbi:MAG: hypothetical protein DWQ07_24115 [Chloroflexi bacterium]|nr:MAG: hypothetical protein DWQ07_24115 [Chloroflexota bacterium]MBL1196219.1 hypothetical protein [Chloroflexota bacterium]NOH13513.1 hypothetical protein [Chloroflexota bacterium]